MASSGHKIQRQTIDTTTTINGRSNGKTMAEIRVAIIKITSNTTRMKEVATDEVHYRNRGATINTSSNSGRIKGNIRSRLDMRSRTTMIGMAMLNNLHVISTDRDLLRIDNINMMNDTATMDMVDLHHQITIIRMGRGDHEINGRSLARLKRGHDVSAGTLGAVFILTRGSQTENSDRAVIAKELSMGQSIWRISTQAERSGR
jgi:hypothetical protein